MSITILLTVALGVLSGIFLFPESLQESMGFWISFGLGLLLFFVGIDIGSNRGILGRIRRIGFKVFLVPLMVAVGSILGTTLAGIVMGMNLAESAAIGAGFGWYSLSAIELSKHSAYLGTLAFVTNISREVIALVSIPFIAKYIGKLEAIAPAGATAMDTVLPVISRSTNAHIAIISFITGVVLSSMVPILVPLLMLFS
ncbi:lysine exporter LysO family protein [Isachenkonia alkalipeptolytica]|uniref:Lysine exporter LysO family protein n=1 Tax=Isachenkonia alkalipeptolytica TaxID=2565777 RepID=A0AA43XIY1_9CLOT|nr:lysine exporter LysO family protein [Isachenkonia alkalipeptolytica]